MNAEDIIGRLRNIQEDIGTGLDSFGGFLRCEVCGETRDLNSGDAGRYTSQGWPRHCDLTMRWWTQRQIDAGDVTVANPFSRGRSL
jgi:hypothetical protein